MKYFRHAWILLLLFCVSTIPVTLALAENGDDACIKCHSQVSPGQVADWRASKHSGEDVGCVECHGDKHMEAKDYKLAVLPDEKVCAQCHEDQFGQFTKGKYNLGLSSMMALPVTHLEPDELIEGCRDAADATTWG